MTAAASLHRAPELSARSCNKCFTRIRSCNPRATHLHPWFTEVETEAQRGVLSGLGSHSPSAVKQERNAEQSETRDLDHTTGPLLAVAVPQFAHWGKNRHPTSKNLTQPC